MINERTKHNPYEKRHNYKKTKNLIVLHLIVENTSVLIFQANLWEKVDLDFPLLMAM